MNLDLRLFIALLFVAPTAAEANPSKFNFSVAPGSYGVGLRIVKQYDHAREFKGKFDLLTGRATVGERARPVQTLVWYPAGGAGKRINYRSYVESAATEVSFDLAEPQVAM